LLVVGGTVAPRKGGPPALQAVGTAYDPATDTWRRLPRMESGRTGAAAVWTGRRLLLWGGQTTPEGESVTPSHGLAYDPGTNRWSALPASPLLGRNDPAAVWTGGVMLVWGGSDPYFHPLVDGARFRPATP
jgi:N-acetylneuraminic acid mutarotase